MRKYIPDKLVDMMMNVGNEFKTYYKPIRGGSDGSRLSEMGLATPNIWNGSVNYHSIKEFVVVDDAVDAVLYLHKLLHYKE